MNALIFLSVITINYSTVSTYNTTFSNFNQPQISIKYDFSRKKS